MNAPQTMANAADIETQMLEVLKRQREDYIAEGRVSAEVRKDRLRRGIDIVLKSQDQIVDALNSDFSCRPREVTLLTDVAPTVQAMKHAMKSLDKWMRREKRSTMFPLNLLGGRSFIEYQPLGVVGVISPWNFPVQLTFGPLAGILAAGNRVMIKPSEFTPATSELMTQMVGEAFDEKEIAIFPGGPEVGQAFSGLAFDHMLFTGATGIARHIMSAAARNLVPVTLELGGKSPVIISRDTDLEVAARRIMLGKTMNAGQICLAPDYLMVPEEKMDEMVSALKSVTAEMYPTMLANRQYTSVVNERHYQRLTGYLDDAAERGATVEAINPANEDFSSQDGTHKIPPTLILNPPEESKVLEDEIFGPLLPIRSYNEFSETINYVNAHPRPLAAYYFGENAAEEDAVLNKTTSGGVCINDVIMHVTQEDLPFGGVGPSGTGAYHGEDGFKNFSHAKAVYRQSKFNVAKLAGLLPPYGSATEKSIKMQTKA
ncbi:MAG: coniferyl aldehyde dehydrogenase [Pseudomonadota bacterium]